MDQVATTSRVPVTGKVLVIGFDGRSIGSTFKDRVISKSAWEVLREEDMPQEVIAVCFFSGVKPDAIARIRRLAGKKQVDDFRTVPVQTGLRNCLGAILGVQVPQVVQFPSALPPALVPELSADELKNAQVALTKRIRPQLNQPRTYFNKKRMAELTASIVASGQITPVIVKRVLDDPDYDYELIEGERRLKVCLKLDLPTMLICVREVANIDEQFMLSFAANFAREGHTHLETAKGIDRVMKVKAREDIPRRQQVLFASNLAGKSEMWAEMHLRLLTLPPEVQGFLEPDEDDNTRISLSLGNFLASIARPDIQLRVARESFEKKLKLQEAKRLARQLAIEAGLTAGSAERTPNKDYNIMRNYLRHTIQGAVSLLDMPHRTLEELFTHRGLEERNQALKEIDEGMRLLAKIKKTLTLKH